MGQRGRLLFYKVRFGLEGGIALETEPHWELLPWSSERDGLHPIALGLGLEYSMLIKIVELLLHTQHCGQCQTSR